MIEVILDTETTGLSAEKDRIVEIACVELSHHIPTKNIFHTWYSKKKLVEENNKLNQDLKKLEIDNLRLVYLESFLESNTALPKGDDSVLYAKIIKKNNRGTLTINAGQKDDITVGDWAVNTDGTLLGFVDVVYDSSSEIALFNKSNIETQVILFPENVSLTTKGNGNALVSDVPREVNVEIGNIVYSQEKAGFIIGKVSVIDFDPRDPFKRVYVRPINSIQNLQDISIIKKAPNSVIE